MRVPARSGAEKLCSSGSSDWRTLKWLLDDSAVGAAGRGAGCWASQQHPRINTFAAARTVACKRCSWINNSCSYRAATIDMIIIVIVRHRIKAGKCGGRIVRASHADHRDAPSVCACGKVDISVASRIGGECCSERRHAA